MAEPKRSCWRSGRLSLVAAAGALALVTGISACATPAHPEVSPAVTRHFKGLPKGTTIPRDRRTESKPKPWATWAGQRSVYVMTWGSGSCPKLPSSVRAIGANRVVIRTREISYQQDAVCTADLAVTTSVVRLPQTVATTHAVLIWIDGHTTRLPVRPR